MLIEEKKDSIHKGHTSNYILVHCEADLDIENKIVTVKCDGANEGYITGIVTNT